VEIAKFCTHDYLEGLNEAQKAAVINTRSRYYGNSGRWGQKKTRVLDL